MKAIDIDDLVIVPFPLSFRRRIIFVNLYSAFDSQNMTLFINNNIIIFIIIIIIIFVFAHQHKACRLEN